MEMLTEALAGTFNLGPLRGPLATSVTDLVPESLGGTFPSARASLSPIEFWLRPETPVLLVVAYLLSKPVLKVAVEKLDVTGKSAMFKAVVAAHNLLLVVFSGTVFLATVPMIYAHAQSHGALATYCDFDGSLWYDSGFGVWSIIFYLSKYYEFADTWVLVMKRKEPSLLQVYHHAGIAITMWAMCASQSVAIMAVVCLNSFVHTVMYTYFLLSTFGIKVPGAKYLTTMQLTQFAVGILGTLGHHVIPGCSSEASRLALAVIQLYAVGLIVLFSLFFKKKYKSKSK